MVQSNLSQMSSEMSRSSLPRLLGQTVGPDCLHQFPAETQFLRSLGQRHQQRHHLGFKRAFTAGAGKLEGRRVREHPRKFKRIECEGHPSGFVHRSKSGEPLSRSAPIRINKFPPRLSTHLISIPAKKPNRFIFKGYKNDKKNIISDQHWPGRKHEHANITRCSGQTRYSFAAFVAFSRLRGDHTVAVVILGVSYRVG
jgi:hypothetical protein